MNLLITGASGDIAKSIIDVVKNINDYIIYAPTREEMDVTSQVSIENYLANKDVDVLINNAGYIVPKSIEQSDYDNIYRTISINLIGCFNVANAILKKNPNAYIINIGSSAATKAHADWSAYCASKSGIVMATKCWHLEGIKTICLSPGRTATKMRYSLFTDEDPETLLKPSDFAKVVLKALNYEFKLGENIDVNTFTIGELLK